MLEELTKCNLCGSLRINSIDKEFNISLCNDCKYVFDNPRPTLNALKEYYSKSGKYDEWLTDEKERDVLGVKRVSLVKNYVSKGKLLDVGAGIGQFLHYAKKYFEVDGIEVSKSGIQIAKDKYKMDIMEGAIEDVDFDGKKFDVITVWHVLEHVPNPEELINICKNLLVEDGLIFIAVPNDVVSFKVLPKTILKKLGVKRYVKFGIYSLPKIKLDGSLDEIHLSHFTPKVLKGLFERLGFEIVELGLDPYYLRKGFGQYLHDLHFGVCSFINSLIGRNGYDTILLVARKKG